MPPWELQALEYIVGAVLLGLALMVSTDAEPLCGAYPDDFRRDTTFGPVEVCTNDDRR